MLPICHPYPTRRWLHAGLAAVLLLAASFSPAARAAPAAPAVAGELDTSFGGYGEVGRTLTPVSGTEAFRDAVQLPDGSVIAVGSNGAGFLISKFTPSGAPDTSFGGLGSQVVDLSAATDVANAVVVTEDGRILVAGVANTGAAASFGVVRLYPDGSPDSSFNGDGMTTIDFNGHRDVAEDIIVTEQGDILVVGTVRTGGMFCPPACDDNIGLARLKGTDGALDPLFGTGGKVQTNLAGNESGLAVFASSACGIYAAGARAADINAAPQFVIASYQTSGAPSGVFGVSGVVTGTALTRIVDLTCLSDGTLVALGDDASDVGLLRLNYKGEAASGFGTSGLAKIDFGGVDVAGVLEVLPDRTTLVAGNSGQQVAEVRVGEQGNVMTGTLRLTDPAEAGATAMHALDLALVPDVRYRAVVSVETDAGPGLALTRRFLDGSLEDGGWQALDYDRNTDEATAVAFQPDGKLLVAGSTWPSGGNRVGLLARFTVDGELDEQFAVGGMIVQGGTVEIEEFTEGARGLLVEPDGNIVVVGSAFDLIRLNEAGLSDSSFGTQGYASADWPDTVSGPIARQSDGKFVLAGYRRPTGQNATFAVARFTAGGVLDGTFGAGGTVATGVGPYSAGADVAIQPDGKIVVAGLSATDVQNQLTVNFALVRYLTDGSVDNSFGTNGRVTTDFGSGEVAYSLVALPDGKLLAAGYSQGQGMALARYLPTGALDPSFGTGGKVLLQLAGSEVIFDLALAGPNLVAAVCDYSATTGLVARLTLEGAFDNSFNGNGRAPFNFPGGGCAPGLVIAVGPGRIAAVSTAHAGVGSSSSGLTDDFAVAMYLNDAYLTERLEVFLPLVRSGP